MSIIDDLQSVSAMFTGSGWQSFQETLVAQRMLKTVIAEKLVMNAEPTGAASITEQGLIRGAMLGSLVPLLVKMQRCATLSTPVRRYYVGQRVSLVNNPDGVGIIQMLVVKVR